jgi:uncharacterized protein YjbJ (UPF0337 family)
VDWEYFFSILLEAEGRAEHHAGKVEKKVGKIEKALGK